MRRSIVTRILVITLCSAAGVILLILAGVFAASEWKLRRSHDAPIEPLATVSTAADLEEGKRLAIIVGCWAGCHGMQGEGDTMEAPGIFRVTGPTLSQVLPDYSDEELVRLIRYGVKRDGRSALGMASKTFYFLSDEDLSRIVAHLRRGPNMPPVPRERHVTIRGRIGLALGMLETSADEVDRSRPRWGSLPRKTAFERGRYIASITCTECHGLDLQGDEYEGSPSLSIVAGYSLEQFRHLLQTGQPLDGRDLGIMSWTARNAFTYFTDQEIVDLYAYLRANPG